MPGLHVDAAATSSDEHDKNAPEETNTVAVTGDGQTAQPKPASQELDAQPAAPMAVGLPELDDFGLPIRKYVAPVLPETETSTGPPTAEADPGVPGEAKQALDGPADKSTATKSEDTDSGSEDEFKDAVSGPQSDTVSRVDGDMEEQSKLAVPVEAVAAANPVKTIDKPKEEPKAEAVSKAKPTESGAELEATPTTPVTAEAPAEPITTDQKSSKEKEGSKKPQPGAGHNREKSEASILHGGAGGISEFSHQQLTTKQPEKKEDDDGEWQVMPAFAPYDIYDDDNRLIAKEFKEDEHEDEKYGYGGLGGAGKGYTRVLVDDDAESATSMDENTQYLFRDKGQTTAVTDEDDVQRDAVSQLQATKELLTEGQRVAYVGLVRLELAVMTKEVEGLQLTRKTKKELAIAAESMKMWGQKMMIRLYAHMDISPAEQIMIEQLTAHGVLPQDLTPLLMANARVKNPMAEDKNPSPTGSGSAKSSRPSSVVSPELEQPATPPPAYQADDDTELTAPVKMPSEMPTTQKIDIDLRWTVLCDLFLVLIADSVYDSRSRVLLEKVGKDLEIPWIDICRFEKKVTDALEMQQQAEKENWNEDEHMEIRRKRALKRRYVMMGLATVGGGLVIGLSAGLLAPVIGAGLAAGFTTIGVSGTGTFLAGAGGAAIITSTAATSGSIIGGRAANRRTGAVKTFEYRPLHNNKRVNLIVTVSGWMTGKVDDVRLPFSTVDPVMGDLYSILWEPEMLRTMGDTINILATEALTQGLQQVLGSTVLVALMSALQLPVVLTKLSYLIDNPWAVSLDRATAAGLILADSLIDRNLGTRPVTLVGYSIGSRVIFSCLQELCRKGAYGLVQNVFLFGSPVVVKQEEYLRARAVVSGRFVNGYNRNDWILGYLFRLTNGGIRRVAGLAAVEGVPDLDNMDVSELVAGHMDYRRAMPRLLRECGWMIESDEFTEIEEGDPENHQERQRELINEIEEARKQAEKEAKEGKGTKGAFAFFRKKKAVEKQEWEIYEDSNKAGATGARTEDKEGNNHGVLFDVDAIRAELAKEKGTTKNGDIDDELLQVREIKSTLPPMKLDLSPSLPPAARSPRDSLRETRSAEVVPYRSSGEYRSSNEYRPPQSRQTSYSHQRKISLTHQRKPSNEYRMSSERTPTFPASKVESSYYQSPSSPGRGNDIQMTFDTAFEEPKPQPKTPVVPSSRSASISQSTTAAPPTKPELKSAQTVPNITLSDPWADYDDEEEFGKEKEISMTFA
ncbi:hypothetical protein OQA88_6775 [Cercophora sp. LCS_1]